MSVSLCTGGLTAYASELPAETDAPVVQSETNIFLGKTATASSTEKSNVPGNALDDDPATKWCAQPSSSQQEDPSVGAHWIQIDLGGLYNMDRISFVLEDKNNSIQENNAIYKYKIAVSESADITEADVIIDKSENTEMIWTVEEDLGGVLCRYVRIYLNCATERNWPCIIDAYGYGEAYVAPQEGVSLTLDYDGAVQQGDTFQVPLQLGGLTELSDPLYLMQMELNYPDGFSCTSIEPADGIGGTVTYYQAPGESSCTVLYDADSFDTGLPAEGTSLFTATFAVAADTAPDSYRISMDEPLLITTIGNVLTADLTAASVTVEEKSEPVETYTVSFESNGGTPVDSQEITENGTVTKPEDPTREGYTFAGWYVDEALETPYDFSQAVTSNFTLYAKWTENITYYTVTFNSNGGSLVENQTVAEDGTVSKPADPTREGYTFTGWYSDEACTQIYDFASAVTGDLTLYAGWQENITYYTVTFNSNGGSPVESQTVAEDGTVSKPADPTNGDFDFDGWYIDASCTTPYDFTTPVTGNLELFAGWKMVGPSVDHDDDKEEPTDPEEPENPDIEEPETPLNPTPDFTDVADDFWGKEAIDAVVEQGLMTGTSETTFAPNATTTRAMLMTILARMDGVDTTGSNPWYAKGMEWAVAEGISDGTNPEATITREQLAVMLYRYAGSPESSGTALDCADADQISDWAYMAMHWAVSNGIISGKGNDTLDPQGSATRAEVAQMLYRFVNL